METKNKKKSRVPTEPITTVVAISGNLRFPNGYCSGSGESDTFSDQPLRRNLDGRLELEGKSVAGALYHHLLKFYPSRKAIIDFLFDQDKRNLSSPLQIEHLQPIFSPSSELANFRDGINLRRDLDSTRAGKKFDYETTVRGLRMTMKMKLEIRQGCEFEDQLLQLLATLLRDLEAGRCSFGGRTGSGFGHGILENAKGRIILLPAKLKEYLLSPDPAADTSGRFISFPGTSITLFEPEVEITTIMFICNITPEHPFLIRDGGRTEAPVLQTPDGKNEIETDAWPVTLLDGNGESIPVITGPGTKGMLRARCEKILRTLWEKACDPSASSCEKAIEDKLESLENNGPASRTERKKIINDHSCMICRIFGNTYRRGRISCADAEITDGEKKLLFSVPLNRFTSGPGNLFNRLPFLKGSFTLQLDAFGLSSEETTLLLLALRDLDEEESMPLCFGGCRYHGYGRVNADEIKVIGNNAEPQTVANLLNDEDRQREWEKFLGPE